MAPIRIGLIGLSTGSKATSWASAAHLPYLLSSQGKAQYDIVALCNSSVDSAKKSIEHYKLGSSVKAYDSPKDLANDSNVDLVVCVVGVEKHYELLKPVIEAGKDAYTELPLASNIDQMRELATLAEKKGIKTMFGSQGQAHPAVKLVKKLIDEGKIGNVLSTSVRVNSGLGGGDSIPVVLRYLVERNAGGNHATISFLHSFNCVLDVFGELEAYSSIMGIERPKMNLIDPSKDGKVVDTISKDTPDNILIQGRFQSGPLLSYQIRNESAFPGEPGCRWTIDGDEGEIMITNPAGLFDIVSEGLQVKLHKRGQENAETVELPSDDLSDLKHPSQNVGRLYEAFAKRQKDSYADWKVALRRHELIEEMFRRSDGNKPVGETASYLQAKSSFKGSDADAQATIVGDKQTKPQDLTRDSKTTAETVEEEGFDGSHGAIAS